MLEESSDKLPSSDRESLESAVAEVKKALESDDTEGLSKSMEGLTSVQHKVAEEMYKQASQAQPPDQGAGPTADGTGEPSGTAEGDVIDAEVVEDKK